MPALMSICDPSAPIRRWDTLISPIYRSMLGDFSAAGELRAVETILHEMAHSTVFLPGASDLNESFATRGHSRCRPLLSQPGDLTQSDRVFALAKEGEADESRFRPGFAPQIDRLTAFTSAPPRSSSVASSCSISGKRFSKKSVSRIGRRFRKDGATSDWRTGRCRMHCSACLPSITKAAVFRKRCWPSVTMISNDLCRCTEKRAIAGRCRVAASVGGPTAPFRSPMTGSCDDEAP